MNIFFRVGRYTKLHLFRDPVYFFLYLLNYFSPLYVPKVKYYQADAIRNFLLDGKSIIRLGDGETFILNGGSLPGQEFSEELQEKLHKCIVNYSREAKYVLCLNRVPLAKTNFQLRKEGLIPCWLPSKVFFELYFRKNEKYLDAAMFYYGDTIPRYFEEYLMSKHLLLISNEENIDRFKANINIPFSKVHYLTTASKNAYTDYLQIKNKVESLGKLVGKKNLVVLAAFGPASKVLAYDISKQGIQVIDIGQGIEVAYSDKKLYKDLDVLR